MLDRPLVILNAKYPWPQVPPWKPTAETKITAVCPNCEYEWDMDKLPADGDCPDCGSQNEGDNVVRAEANES